MAASPCSTSPGNWLGIITSKDVIRTLLVEMNREVLRLELKHQKQGTDLDTVTELEYTTTRYDFEAAGHASTEIKKELKRRNLDPKIIRRIAIAAYELEINQVVHSYGGTIHASIQGDRVVITADDTGPGIENVELALREGWSTANEWIRSLGFGAGMGLANTQRVRMNFLSNQSPEWVLPSGRWCTLPRIRRRNNDYSRSGPLFGRRSGAG